MYFMYDHTRITVDLKNSLYKKFLKSIEKSNYTNHTDVMRDMVRKFVDENNER